MLNPASGHGTGPRKFSLRVIFILSTLLQVVTAVGLTGYFSFRNGQRAVNDVATHLRDKVTTQVRERLLLYVDTPHLINQLNANAIDLGGLDRQNFRYKERYFWQQIRTFPGITHNFYGTITGEYVGARRLRDGSLQVIQRDQSTSDNHYFATNELGDRTRLVQVAQGFDARKRPWYLQASKARQASWSEVYADFSTGALTVTAVKPVYDHQGSLKGVLGSDFIFSQINEFLQGLKIGTSGKIFIMERSGFLVATSTPNPTYQIIGKQTRRIKASESSNYLIRQSAAHLEQRFGNLEHIQHNHRLDFDIHGARQFLQVTPLHDGRGLDWLIVVVAPEADFMGHIKASTRITALLCLLSLVIATVVGLQTSRWIVKPILRLNTAAKQLAYGHWEQELPVQRTDEIGELADSFNRMTEQLKEAFSTLEQKVRDRTKELAQANRELENKNTLIRKIFGRYLSDDIVANLLETPDGLALGGERRKITILTSDLRGFTATAERLPPEEVIKILNFYLEYMADVITHYEGTIDEFMGDGILALFGAPTVRVDNTERAIACAVAMQQAMAPVNQQMRAWGFPALEMGIGVHTGEVVVGNIGSEKRSKYGVVGNHVNLTYRIEACTVGGQILISEAAHSEVGNLVQVESQKQVQMKGINHPITLYEISGIAGDYNLSLSRQPEIFRDLPKAIPLQYVALESKHVGDRSYSGQLVSLSCREALMQHDTHDLQLLAPLTNLKLTLMTGHATDGTEDDFYAKVLDKSAPEHCVYIHFTAMPPTVQKLLDTLYQAGKSLSPSTELYSGT
jgi:class 3 adenylate cyclase